MGEIADLVAEAELAHHRLAKARQARAEGEQLIAAHLAGVERHFEKAVAWEQAAGEAAMDEEYLRQDRLARGWSSSHIDRQAATEAWRQAPGGRGAEGERSLRLTAARLRKVAGASVVRLRCARLLAAALSGVSPRRKYERYSYVTWSTT